MRGSIEDKAFLILIVAVSLAFGWILTSFYGAILWGVVIFCAYVVGMLIIWLVPRTPPVLAD